jgi:predicted MFS family arabinose efflux permease
MGSALYVGIAAGAWEGAVLFSRGGMPVVLLASGAFAFIGFAVGRRVRLPQRIAAAAGPAA